MSKSFGKRLLAIVLSVLMVMTLMPTGMFAADSVEVTADNYQELLNVPLGVNSFMRDHVSWSWNGCGWNSTTLGGTVSVDEDWFGDTYDGVLTSDNTSEWTVNPSFCLSISDGGYFSESDKEVGYTGEAHTYNFTYSDIVIAANGYNDVVISGATVETVFQFVQYSGYYGGTSYDIDLLTPIMEQTGLTLQQVAEEYIPAIYNVKFSATLNSFDGVSYSDIQAYLDGSGSGETGDTGEYDLSGYTLSYSEDINLAASNYSWYTFSDTAIVDAMATEGSKFVVTRSTSVTEANYDKFGLVDAWFSMDWLNLGTAISKAADETGTATVIDCEFDNGVTVVYDGTTIYNALVAAGFYSGAAAQFISNTSTETYTITNVSVYVPTTTSTSTTLPWELTSTDYVSNWDPVTFYQVAIDGFTYGDWQWSTLIQPNSSEPWYEGNLDLWDGFIEALLSDNATFEITSTSANTFLVLQAGANFGYGLGVYVYADSVVDNGDGTYTTTISCASALSAFASATQEGYEGSPAVPTGTSDYGDLYGLVISSSDESATLSSFKIVDSTASSGDSGGSEDSGITFDTGDYDFSRYTVAGTASFTDFTSSPWTSDDFDMAIIEALNTEGSLLVITRSEGDANAGYDKFLLIDTWWSMTDSDDDSPWLALGTRITTTTDSEGPADVDCIFDNGTTVVYDGATVYAALMELGLNTSSGADMSLISNSGSTPYNITSVTAYVPTTVSVLSWVDEAVAENNLTISGPTWWYGIIYCTEAYEGEVGEYADGVSADLDGFLAAIARDDAVIEITSTGSGIDQIFIQKASDYSGTDSLNMTITDNGDGTYTSTLSGAELSAYADAVVEEGGSIWKIMINKTTDCDTVITSISVYVPGSTSLPWVDEPLAENNLTLSGQTWWTQLIICTEAASEEDYDSYVSTDMEGFLAAIAENDAVLEITSTGSGVDQIFFQYKVSDEVYDATDAISMTITDNGDGTYTSAVSGADLNALVTAFEAEGCSAWKLWINKTTVCDTVLTSMQVVEGTIVEPEDTEFDLSSYTLWYSEEVNIASSDWSTYEFTDTSWVDALTADGAILVISRDTDTVTFSGSDVWDKFFIFDSSWTNSISLGTKTSTDCTVNKTFDNGSMIVYSGASVYNALTSAGVDPAILVNNSTADTYNITNISVYIPTATILAANQEMIDAVSALLDEGDDTVYVNQSVADGESGYMVAGWSALYPYWGTIESELTTSLGEEGVVTINMSNYVAPVAGTTDDPDGTDGSLTLTYYAYVGDSEAGTYVASQTYTVTIVIKATQLYHIDTPTDPDGRFTVTPSTEYATEGERVTVTIETAEGYKVSEVRAWYQDENGNTNPLGIGYNENTGVWSITMPAYDIWIGVTVGTLDVNYDYDSDAVFLVNGATAANEGEEVTFYVYVNRGYELDGEITAVDENGNTVTLTEVYSGLSIINFKPSTAYAYSFTMPDSSVTITATSFKAIDGFIDGAFYITDYGDISFIDQVDFTDSDTYLVISYDLMFESDENVDNYGDWSPGGIYAVTNDGEWIQLCEIPSYYSSNGTFAISLADIAALASDAGCNIDTYGVIINWWVNDDEYASNEDFTLVSADHAVNTEVVGSIASDNGADVFVEGLPNEGSTITVTITPDVGYALGSVVATDANGNEIELTILDCGDHEYSFTMPDADVTIEVTVIPDSELTEVVSWYNNGYSYRLTEDGILDNEYTDYADNELYLCFIYDYSSVDDRNLGSIGYGVGDYWNWLCDIPINESGRTYISLAELAQVAGQQGYEGEYFAYAGTLDWSTMGYAIVTSGDLLEVNYEVTGGNGGTYLWTSGLLKEDHAMTTHIDVESGYILRSITATDEEGNEVELTRDYMGYWDVIYTFTMPATDVTINLEIVSLSELTAIVTEGATGDTAYVWTEYGSPIFYSDYVDFTDSDLYLVINYEAKDDHEGETVAVVSYGDEHYDGTHDGYDGDSTLYQDVLRIMDNGTGTVAVSLTDIQAAVDASGIASGNYYLWAYTGEYTITSVSISTLGDYEPVESSVGEVVTIGNVDYEITWDTTTANPISVMHEWSNGLGNSVSMYSGWEEVFISFAEAVVSHIGDGSLVLTESEPQAHARLQLNTNDFLILETEVYNYGDNATYISIDEAAELAESEEVNSELTVDTLNSLQIDPWVSHDENGSVNISAVRILTPLTYEVDSTAWSVDMTSATVKLVAGNHVVYVDATDVISEVTEATCTTAGQVVYTATAAYNGQVFEVSTTATIPATGHTEAEAVVENRVEATCTEDGSYDSVVYCSVCGEELSRETVTIPATGHTEGEAVEENRVEATCTEDGSYDSVVYCSVCGEELSRETITIPATGHEYVAVVTDPTCTESGYTTYTCSICGDSYTADETEATGHDYGEPEWTWSGYTSATATFTCGNDSTHVEVVTAEITSVTTAATCEEDGETVYTATVTFNGETYTTTTTEVLTALGHDWTVSYEWSEDGKTCTATHVCANDAEHNVSETVTTSGVQSVAPTCTEKGTTTYTATFTSSWAETKTMDVVDIDALGHTEGEAVEENRVEASCTEDGSYDSVVYCSVCGEELSRETVTIPATGHTEAEAVVENRVEATCTADGSYDTVVYCSVCGAELSRETTTIPATGHTEGEAVEENRVEATCTTDGSYDTVIYCSVCGEELSRETTTIPAIGHNYGEPVWTWSGYTSATATFTCGNDSTHVEVVTAEITSVTTDATCEDDGETVYTATVTFNGETYTTTTTEVLTALGHDWTVSYEWSEDGKTCTATRSCANDAEHNVSETVTTSGAQSVAPTCTEKGTTTYTATFTSDWAETKTMDVVDVDALGHDWSVEYTWSEDGKSCTATHVCGRDSTHNESETVTTVGTETVAPTCTEKGTTTYTATFTADWADTKTMDVADIDALGHTYGEPEFTWDESTCTATATFTCTVCQYTMTLETDRSVETTNATCTVDGKTVYTAAVTLNNTEYTDTYEVTIPATGHSTEIQGAKDATCTEDGYTGDEVCTICGETVAYGETIPAAHTFGDDGVCTVCGAKKDNSTETTEPTVSVESGDVIFAEVLPSGLVTEVEIKLSVDSGTVVVSTVTEDDSNPHLVEHISDTLGFELFNEAQGDDLVKDTNSFTITDGNSTTPKKATILFYGDIDYDGNSASVTMTFASTTVLSKSDIYVLHYTGVGTTWEIVSSTSNASGKTLTVDFDATSFSPYVVVSVANVSSTSGGTTVLDILLKVSADYSAVNDAIAKATALDPADYVDFTAVTEAINSVNWNLTAINQQAVTAYADAINAAIDALVKVTSLTEEDVNIDEPIEDSTTETEDEEVTTPIATPVDSEESNPTTGLALSLLPMAIAALAAVSSKRR